MTSRTAVFLAVIVASVPLALAQGTYTQIDVPGSAFTAALGINNAGDIVGSYWDFSGNAHGFLLSGGVYTTIDYPQAANTSLNGINDLAQVVGESIFGGFVYDVATATFTLINYPGSTSTEPTAINNAGVIVGSFWSSSNSIQGFELTGSTYTSIVAPRANSTQLLGISLSGTIVGFANIKPNNSGISFLYGQGKFRQAKVHNIFLTVLGINNLGNAVVGSYGKGPTYGFLFQNRMLKSLEPSQGALAVNAIGVNDSGEVVGLFYDKNSALHGFTWTPPAGAKRKEPSR